MTQEALAGRSGLSVRAIRKLESPENRRPHADTVGYLADALDLRDEERRIFEGAARGRPVHERRDPEEPAPDAAPLLPEPPTPLFGREVLVSEGVDLLRGGTRLLTITGPGGVGKTRVGLRLSDKLRPEYRDGAVLIDLETIGDPEQVAPTLARVLGFARTDGRTSPERLLEGLRAKEILLFLDNFEQVRAAAPLLTRLLSASPGLRLLVTSRIPLKVRGEQELVVRPLQTPVPSLSAGPEATDSVSRSPAIELFVDRAAAVDPDFELDASNAAAVAEVCRQVDGLPLAIELAASRVKVLPPAALLSRLNGHGGAPDLALLARDGPDLPERQRTMRRTVSWSYDLLSGGERTLLRHLSAFSGGCTLAAAEAVCPPLPANDGERGDGERLDVLDGMAGLLDASLVARQDGPAGEPRFGMLRTIREYARELLVQSGEAGPSSHRHAAHFLRLAETAEPELWGPDESAWLDRLERERGNLRASLAWAEREGDTETGLRLVGALRVFWSIRGDREEGRKWAEAFLSADPSSSTSAPLSAWATGLHGAAHLAHSQGDWESAAALFGAALESYRGLADKERAAMVLTEWGQATRAKGDVEQATTLSEEGLALARETGDFRSAGTALGTLGRIARREGDRELANARVRESLALFEQIGDRRGTAYALNGLGIAALDRGEPEDAQDAYERGLGMYDALGDTAGRAYSLIGLGDVARKRGDETKAAALYEEALELHRELGNERGVARALARLHTHTEER